MTVFILGQAGTVSTNTIGVRNSMSKVVLSQPVKGTVERYTVNVRQASVQVGVADGTTCLLKRHQRDDSRSGYAPTGGTDEAPCYCFPGFLRHMCMLPL